MGINGKRIRERRKALGLTLAELAARVGINPAHLWRMETGRSSNPNAQTLGRLADALGVAPGELLQPLEPDTPTEPQEFALTA